MLLTDRQTDRQVTDLRFMEANEVDEFNQILEENKAVQICSNHQIIVN